MFTESALPFSSHYGSAFPNLPALISEYMLTISVTAMLFLVLGLLGRRNNR